MRILSFQHAPIALAALLALGALPATAQVAAGTLPVVRPGGAVINATVGTPANNALAITQTASQNNRALIEWTSFSIGSAGRVTITQPNAQSLLVNRVTGNGNGPTASEIHGSLTANGRVMLVNPAGVMFGNTAQVSTGSLVASALDLDASMTASNYAALVGSGDIALSGGSGGVEVQGASNPQRPQIQVTEGGSIVLLSQAAVRQNGFISAPGGNLYLGTGSEATLRAVGSSGFVQVAAVTASEPSSSQVVTGFGSQTIARGGSIVIGGTPEERGSARGDQIDIAGVLSTASTTGSGGSIHIDAGRFGSVAIADASVDASSTVANGGRITVLGNNLAIRRGEGPSVEALADGATGGGTIAFGNTDTRAILVGDEALLSADATGNGNGGSILLRAMFNDPLASLPVPRFDFGVTEAYGTMRARGGTLGGNGGNVETSGMAVTTTLADQNGLVFRHGTIDARARVASGRNGTWTLDPYDVTISNAGPQDVNGSFEPTGPGANVNAADISASLDAGTSVVISTEAGGAGSAAGNITVVPGTVITRTGGTTPTSLTLRANNDIVWDSATLDASRAAPVNLNLFSDVDGNGTGRIVIARTSSILTGGGSVTLAGGTDATSGFARGDNTNAGVTVDFGSVIDTRSSEGLPGDIIIRGQGGTSTGASHGVALSGDMTMRFLQVEGRAGNGYGIQVNGARLTTEDGAIDLRGVAARTNTNPQNLIGVDLSVASIQLGVNGSLTVAGRGDDGATAAGAVGLRTGDVRISASTDSNGTVTLVGEAAGNTIAPGIQVQTAANGGVVIRSDANSNTSAASGVNVIIGAQSNVPSTALEFGVAGITPTILTTGAVNLKPMGVDSGGAIGEANTTPIFVAPIGSATPTGFVINPDLLRLPTATVGGIQAGGGVIIGSASHQGAISLEPGALTQHAGVSLNLQNEGGSGGIVLGGGNTLGNLALATAGNVTQTGAIDVQDLFIRAGTSSNVTLDNAGNQINGVLAFDPPATLSVRTAGGLTVGDATARLDNGDGGFLARSITDSVGGGVVLLRAGGDVTLQHSISMAGAFDGHDLQIVSPGTVDFANGSTLSAQNGRWQVWSPTVTGAAQPGATNLYGCVYGDVGTCSVSGIAISDVGNQFLHATRPTINVSAGSQTGFIGGQLPPLTYTVTGLQNGDTAATALTGALAATQTTPTTYAINQGTLASPLGYDLVFTPGVLTLRPVAGTRHMLQSAFSSELSSDVYGNNLDSPYVCTAASVIRGTLGTSQADPLASEWGKVRNQPQLSGCLNVTDGGSCSAF